MEKDWFETWFDSPYYHILYQDRDFEEAESFISNLISYLKPSLDAKILDLACGAGRHSIYLNKLGYDVMGVDLSPNSIQEAKKYENESLHFDTHDMREVYQENEFDYVFSMFTSFGYFESESENIKMLKSIDKELVQGGFFVLDFFNAGKVVEVLPINEVKVRDDISFKIKKHLANQFIIKEIDFEDKGRNFHYQEKVQAISLFQIKQMLLQTNLKIIDTFGDYQLNPFDEVTSDRLIVVAKKD